MVEQNVKGKAQTVLGLVEGSELGITLPHEHFLVDASSYMREPSDPEEKKLAHQKINMENLWYARYHKFSCEDNLVLDDIDMAIREAMYFKQAGGKTIVDMTPINIGRVPQTLVDIAKATSLNIIMGTAYYLAMSYTPEMKMESRTVESIAQEFTRDITVGVGDTGIKAGIIGELGCSWPLDKGEEKVLRAAGIAQQETGAAINIHPGGHPDAPFAYAKILEEVGADTNRVVLSHTERGFPISARSERARLAEKGCYLEFDQFGFDAQWPLSTGTLDPPNDVIRITMIMELIEDGFLDRILVSQDVCTKLALRFYSGGGYAHILKNIKPKMLAKGMTEEQIHTLLVDNPRRINTFV